MKRIIFDLLVFIISITATGCSSEKQYPGYFVNGINSEVTVEVKTTNAIIESVKTMRYDNLTDINSTDESFTEIGSRTWTKEYFVKHHILVLVDAVPDPGKTGEIKVIVRKGNRIIEETESKGTDLLLSSSLIAPQPVSM